MTDHIDRNGLNNVRSNLRVATNQQNSFNRVCKGYYFSKRDMRFHSRIGVSGVYKYLGSFKDAETAGKAYIFAKKKLHNIESEVVILANQARIKLK